MRYTRLNEEEREIISKRLAQNKSIRSIAKELGRSASTISREIKRNVSKTGYWAFLANQKAKANASSRRKHKRRLMQNQRLRNYVEEKVKQGWSPKAIVERLKIDYPHDMSMRISHEAIYQYIYVLPRGTLKQTLIEGLRQERKYRRAQKNGQIEETRGKISGMLAIEERPAEVEDRTVPGHWEGDLILGKYNRSALGTLVERTTRYTILVPLGDKKDAESVRIAYAEAFKSVPEALKRSLTYDQGKEMSQHEKFTIDSGIQVYFAHPSSPWERGTNENTNGLVRQYFPKGTDFTQVTDERIKEVQDLLNDRPRAVLNYYKPDEVFNKLVALNL